MKNTLTLKKSALVAAMTLALYGCSDPQSSSEQTSTADTESSSIWPHIGSPLPADPALEARIEEILADMTVEQKVAQMIQPEIRDITVDDMRRYGFGSFLNGGGAFPNDDKYATPEDWIALAQAMWEASIDDTYDGSSIPTMWGTDAVHGHNNVLGATIFPHNIGLGAANNPQLIEDIAVVTAREVMVTGIDWVFAPTVAAAQNMRWGRTYESYSENPDIIRDYSAAIVRGLQGDVGDDFLSESRVVSTVKHFIGDGATTDGVDQGDAAIDEQTLFDVHAQGYVGGLSAGAQTVMATFNSWNGEKIHGSEYLLTDVLKDQMGFDGFVVGDWNGHGQIPGCTNDNCPQAANAGLDVYMVPTPAWKPLYYNLVEQINQGVIPMSRVDDAVRRVLRVKLRAGLFEKPGPAERPLAGRTELIGSDEHREVARQAVRESLVLMKNEGNLLPLNPQQRILVAGEGADNIGQQAGGWTISWQGTGNTNADFPGGTSIYDGIAAQVEAAGGEIELAVDGQFEQRPDVAVVVFGEQPYAEGNGDIANLEFERGNKQSLALLQQLQAEGIPVVSLFISGRPLWVNPELNASDAFVAVWLPGSEGLAVADVVMASADGDVQHDFVGRLPFSWPANPWQADRGVINDDNPALLPLGFGLSYGDESTLSSDLDTEVGGADDSEPMLVFDRAPQAPWMLQLRSGDNALVMESSVERLDGLEARTFDDQVQEDARRISFNGEEGAGFNFVSQFPRDLRAFSGEGSAIAVTLRVDEQVPDDVMLNLYCGDGCAYSQSISPLLQALPANEWQTLNFDLQCLQQQGFDIAQAASIFGLATETAWTVEFNDIRVLPEYDGDALCLGE
ncbi:MAG: beta-glucosidase [Idiomarina sp.]|nr:beta-glucosidase [Idiomarina sp.]